MYQQTALISLSCKKQKDEQVHKMFLVWSNQGTWGLTNVTDVKERKCRKF